MDELDKYLKEVGARESRATIGPWRGFAGVIRTKHGSHGCNDPDVHKHGTDDSLFIAHSRTDIPKLLEIVNVLRDSCLISLSHAKMTGSYILEKELKQALTKAGEIAKKRLVE